MQLRHGREQSDLIKACAAAHGVTTRAVRKWREHGDERWRKWIARKAADQIMRGTSVDGLPDDLPQPPRREYSADEITIDRRVAEMRITCADLAARAAAAQATGAINDEFALRKMLIAHVESLRRLEKDAPSIQRESGDSVPRAAVETAFGTYSAEMRTRIDAFILRVLNRLPADQRPVIEPFIREEQITLQIAVAGLRLA